MAATNIYLINNSSNMDNLNTKIAARIISTTNSNKNFNDQQTQYRTVPWITPANRWIQLCGVLEEDTYVVLGFDAINVFLDSLD